MSPPTFQIGDEVLITGPTIHGCKLHAGEKFTISWESNGDCTGRGYPWYPASSLRLAEPELKIGDWVRGIYNGHTFQIDYIKPRMESKTLDYSGKDEPMYLASSLRKLTPEEIKQHMAPTKEDLDQIEEKFKMDRRLSAIEKLQEEARKYSDDLYSITETLAERIYALQKRVEFVEKFQREQSEYRRGMLWMAGP